MILLPNGCHCSGIAGDPNKGTLSELSVFPSNWKTVKASTKKDWYIHYRFHDPLFKEQFPKGKFKMVKGMNLTKVVADRRMLTENLMRNELNALIIEGFNPITGHSVAPAIMEHDVSPLLLWNDALKWIYPKLKVSDGVKRQMKYACNFMLQAARQLRFDQIPIKDIRQKHVELCMEHLQKTRPLDKPQKGKSAVTWGAASFNRYRTYLLLMFKGLKKYEAIDHNPCTDIEKQEETPAEKILLTDEETILVDRHLRSKYYTFWRYTRLFFHSGGRTTELLRLKAKDVNLKEQTFILTTTKGKRTRRVQHTITNNALPLWQEIMATAKPEYYIFSENLTPGENKIREEQISRRWQVHVKQKLGIDADFYSNKHSYLNRITELLSLQDAAAAAGHTTTAMVEKHYAKEAKRKMDKKRHERLKMIDITYIIDKSA